MRPLMDRAYSEAARGRIVVAVAPTSYGKTAASPEIWRRSREEGVAGGLIHVAPLRSLLWRAYRSFFEPLGGRLQMHGAPEDVKSPYFLSSLVASTLDSFLWNLYRVPVAEALKVYRGSSMGHYYPALASILTSVTVFDEAHMYLWEETSQAGAGYQAVSAAVGLLSLLGAPLIVETATVRPQALRALSEAVRPASVNAGRVLSVAALRSPCKARRCRYLESLKSEAGRLGSGRFEFIAVDDPEWDSEYLVEWRTSLKKSWDDAINEIVGDASRGPVLVVANSVGEAVRVYRLLEGRVERAVLVHGRLSEGERRSAEDEISRVEREGGVVVATQVAEAGVDVNSIAVYTAAAPLENIVQRAGRACRRGEVLSSCSEEGGKLVIVSEASTGPYPEGEVGSALKIVKEALDRGPVDWRAVCSGDGFTGYGDLLAAARTGRYQSSHWLRRIFDSYLRSDAQPHALIRLLDDSNLCSLARDTIMAEVEVEAGGFRDAVVVSLEWVLSNAGSILEFSEGAPVIVVESSDGSAVEAPAKQLWETWSKCRRRPCCQRLVKALLEDAVNAAGAGQGVSKLRVRLKARQGSYRRGLGLLLPREAGEA